MDFDIASWFSDFSADDVADFGKSVQVAGVATSAIGAFYSTQGQKTALESQAGLDSINARSTYAAVSQQAGLDSINAQMQFTSLTHAADMSIIAAESKAADLRMGSSINRVRAEASAAGSMAGAAIDDNQAHLAELQAQSSLLHGQWEEQSVRMKAAQTKSKRRTRLAAGGIDLGAGTTAAVLTSDEVMAETDVTQVREKALLSALGYRTSAANAQISAGAKRAAAGAALTIAGMQSQMAELEASSLTAQAIADADFKKAMADAGLMNAEAAIDLRKTIAAGNLSNAEAAADTKRTTADSLSPWLSGAGSLISGAGKVAESWYRYNKVAR